MQARLTPWKLSALVVLGAGITGCASTPAPVAEMAVAEAAVRAATTTGTRESAGAQLQLATDKLARARQALADGDSARARRLAEQAQLDAELAQVQAQAQRSRVAAQESQAAARALREELERKVVR
jgi:hypothetical protein